MALVKVWNNSTYSIPEAGEDGWPSLTDFLVDLADNAQTTNSQKYAARTSTDEITNILESDYYVGITCKKQASVILPAVDECCAFIISDESNNASTNNIKITATGATIESTTEYIINSNNQKVGFLYNRGDWRVISNFTAIAFSKSSKDELTNKTIDVSKNNLTVNGASIDSYFKNLESKIASQIIDADENKRGFVNTSPQNFTGVKKFISGINAIYAPIVLNGLTSPIDLSVDKYKDTRTFIIDNKNATESGGLLLQNLKDGESYSFKTINTNFITRFLVPNNKTPIAILFGCGEIEFTYFTGNFITVKCDSNYIYDPDLSTNNELTSDNFLFKSKANVVQKFNNLLISIKYGIYTKNNSFSTLIKCKLLEYSNTYNNKFDYVLDSQLPHDIATHFSAYRNVLSSSLGTCTISPPMSVYNYLSNADIVIYPIRQDKGAQNSTVYVPMHTYSARCFTFADINLNYNFGITKQQ